MRKNVKYFSLIFFFFLGLNTFSQDKDFITGVIVDSITKEPIVFANIHLENRNMGVISNLDGGFKIPLRYREMGSILIISSMGYERQEMSIFDLKVDEANLISLKPDLFELSEAVVRPRNRKKLNTRAIVQKAIDNLYENYPIEPYAQVGYYRDYQLDSVEYVNLNEAIFEVVDQGFKAIDSATTKVLLYNYKENHDFRRDSVASRPYDYHIDGGAKIIDKGYLASYGGNEFTILGVHDAIRNHRIDSYSFVYRFDTDLLKEHKFLRDKDTSYDGEPIYNIRFMKILPSYTAYGRIHISKIDYSIYQMEYAMYDKAKNNSTGVADKNGSKKELIFEISAAYGKKENKMFLNYISFYNLFKLWQPPKLKLESFRLNVDRTIIYKLDNLEVKKKWLTLKFSQLLKPISIQDLKNFRIRYKGRAIEFEELLLIDDKVQLFPALNTKKQLRVFEELEQLAKFGALNAETLDIKVINIQDVEGNIIDKWNSKNYNQFREFFVQQIKPNVVLSTYAKALFMNKKKPISLDQPIYRPLNFNDYWMNTPLKTIQN